MQLHKHREQRAAAENSSDGNADSSDNSSTDVKVEFEEPDTTGNDTQ